MIGLVPHLAYLGIVAYLIVGAFVAAGFLIFGLDRLDEDARGSYAFRPLLVPGLILLWPLVAVRWAILERLRA
jgi:hypothetical protein